MAKVLATVEVPAMAVLMEVLAPSNHGGEFVRTSGIDGGTSTSWKW